IGTALMVVNWALPCSSKLTPVGSPIGFSGAFSRVLARVPSAQRFSGSERCRPSNTSAMGLSATPLCCLFLDGSAIGLIIEDAGNRGQGNVSRHHQIRRTLY